MKIIVRPDKTQWRELLQRPYSDQSEILQTVKNIITNVKQQGDDAIRSYTKKFDSVEIENLEITKAEMDHAESCITPELKTAIQQAKQNIENFHRGQLQPVRKMEIMHGIECWQKNLPVEKIGLYIPGGTAPLFSTVLMLAIPARLAGCSEIILCTPCDKNENIHPAILYAAGITGITRIFKIGGAQAIAAMAYGTKTVPATYKIFGPGNQYVTLAKQLVQMDGIAIDMPAGPSEVCVLADETSVPEFIAADLLSQAEHGSDSQVLLVTTDEKMAMKVNEELQKQTAALPRKQIALLALEKSKAIVVTHIDEAIELVNKYAAEHLIIACKNATEIAESITNAGSVFIGNYAPESVGDYASGTNHVLPTNGFAKTYSGVSVDSFVKKISFQKLSKQGLENIANTVIVMAEAEGLQAHANAVKIRL